MAAMLTTVGLVVSQMFTWLADAGSALIGNDLFMLIFAVTMSFAVFGLFRKAIKSAK